MAAVLSYPMTKVVELRLVRRRPIPTLRELVDRVHELSKDSDNMGFQAPHVQERMKARGKTMREVIEALQTGEGVKGPDVDKYGDLRIKLRRYVGGKRIQVVVAVRDKDFSVITVI